MASDDSILRTLLVIVAVLVLLPIFMMVLMMPMMGMWGGAHMWNGGMWDSTGATWMWLLMWVVLLGILVGGGYLVYRAVRNLAGTETDPALEELRAAYAQGDISDEEFEKRRERLKRD